MMRRPSRLVLVNKADKQRRRACQLKIIVFAVQALIFLALFFFWIGGRTSDSRDDLIVNAHDGVSSGQDELLRDHPNLPWNHENSKISYGSKARSKNDTAARQFTVSFQDRKGKWRSPVKAMNRIFMKDLKDLVGGGSSASASTHSISTPAYHHDHRHQGPEIEHNPAARPAEYDTDIFKLQDELNNNPQKADIKVRHSILSRLLEAGVEELQAEVLHALPTDEQVTSLYGRNVVQGPPVLLGQESCARYRQAVSPEQRYVGVAGMFNTGTTALKIYLQSNLQLPNNISGFDMQVPWGKHRLYSLRHLPKFRVNRAAAELNLDHVFPVVIVRDPYFWMQSMCESPYMASWHVAKDEVCPNLLATAASRGPVTVTLKPQENAQFESLAHLWKDWYQPYLKLDDAPRLIVRLEDLIFQPRQVISTVQDCVLGDTGPSAPRLPFVYLVGQAKWGAHRVIKPQSNMVSSMIKYGAAAAASRRFAGLRPDELKYADNTVGEMMELLQYTRPEV